MGKWIQLAHVDWKMADDGFITQSISDMRDPGLSIFHEAAKAHNQAHYDEKG